MQLPVLIGLTVLTAVGAVALYWGAQYLAKNTDSTTNGYSGIQIAIALIYLAIVIGVLLLALFWVHFFWDVIISAWEVFYASLR